MITIDDLIGLNNQELTEVMVMAKDLRNLRGKSAIKGMSINSEFTITDDSGDIYILNKINKTRVVATKKGTDLQYRIPFEMIVLE